jgi:hypothetical protein
LSGCFDVCSFVEELPDGCHVIVAHGIEKLAAEVVSLPGVLRKRRSCSRDNYKNRQGKLCEPSHSLDYALEAEASRSSA